MTLANYEGVIKNLPYLEQAFETKKVTWQREYGTHKRFSEFCDNVFEKNVLKLSRSDLFKAAANDFYQGMFSVILWGYPRNMRGNTFSIILNSIELIKSFLPNEKHIAAEQFSALVRQLNGTGIGLSTLTKALYFFCYRIDGVQCLILDRRIIDVINNSIFSELNAIGGITEFNKGDKYLSYLKKMADISSLYKYKPDQLEQFLFLFGRNLKPCSDTSY